MEPRNNNRLANLLTSAPLAISLLLLVVNDWYLKAAYGNWFTGKLSDFAGIFLLALLAFALLPRHRLPVAVGIGAFFAWWKSPLAQPVIELVHTAGVSGFNRVADYSDLIALAVVPVAAFAASKIERHPKNLTRLGRLAVAPMMVLCAGSMVATTVMTQGMETRYDVRGPGGAGILDTNLVASAIAQVAEDFDMERTTEENPMRLARYASPENSISYVVLENGTFRIRIGSRKSTDIAERRLRKLERATRDALAGVEARAEYNPPTAYYDAAETSAYDLDEIAPLFENIAAEFGLKRVTERHFEHAADIIPAFSYSPKDVNTIEVTITAPAGLQRDSLLDSMWAAFRTRYSGVEIYNFNPNEYNIYLGNAKRLDAHESTDNTR